MRTTSILYDAGLSRPVSRWTWKAAYAPANIIFIYVLSTLMLFDFGPFDWNIGNPVELHVFVFASLLALYYGYHRGVSAPLKRKTVVRRGVRRIHAYGAVLGSLIVIPVIYTYTGKMPWQVLDVIRDQNQAYLEMGDTLANLLAEGASGSRLIVASIRGLIAPLSFAVIPLTIVNWGRFTRKQKMLSAMFILSCVLLSLFRGTDKEIGEIMISTFSSGLVLLARKAGVRSTRLKGKQIAVLVVAALILVSVAGTLFVDRKQARLGAVDRICVADLGDGPLTCSDVSGGRYDFAVSILTSYASHGYYGLSIALKNDFDFSFGIGHSSFLVNQYGLITNDLSLYRRTYLAKMPESGWDDKAVWSTVFPEIASDVSFFGVPMVMLVFGYLWGSAWKRAVRQADDYSLVFFAILMVFMFYIPANNQIAQTADGYFSFWVWLVLSGVLARSK